MSGSFVVVDAQVVAAACAAYRECWLTRLADRRERLIDAEMRRFWFPPKSRVQAEQSLKKQGIGGEWEFAAWPHRLRVIRAGDLLLLAQLASSVNVSSEDAFIFEALP